MGKKITVPVDIYVPDGHEFDRFGKGDIITALTNFPAFYPIFKPIKQAKKVIDLSAIVGSGIDCEFWDKDADRVSVGKLTGIRNKFRSFEADSYSCYSRCRVRQSPHVHCALKMTSCPLPEGLRVRLFWLDDDYITITTTTDYLNFHWRKVIAFEVLGVAEGWRYEWEEE